MKIETVTRPTLNAERTEDGSQLSVWCDYCYCNHFHGRHRPDSDSCRFSSDNGKPCTCPIGCSDGHRAAHCSSPDSLYRNQGYVLKETKGKPRAITSKSHVLYRFLDRNGGLLYVGVTCNPPTRFKQHQVTKDWWESVANIGIETFSSREELIEAERKTIKEEKPKFNIIHNSQASDSETPKVEPPPTAWTHPLVGKFFHTMKKCSHNANIADWQGWVTGFIDDYLIIELFNWLDGEGTGERLIKISELAEASVVFYSDGDAMRFSYRDGAARHTSKCKDLT